MPLRVEYTPPKVDARVVVAAAAEAGVEAGGKVLLDASQPLVPVEHGPLKASGQVTKEGPTTVVVSYGREDHAGDNGANTSDYAIVQHERLDYNHPNGGQAKYLEAPMHSDAAAVLAAMAEPIRVVL